MRFFVEKLTSSKNFSISILLVAVALMLYKMIFLGQITPSGDSVAREPINQWNSNYKTEHNEIPAWSSILFSGMPTLGSYIVSNYGPLNTTILKLFNKGFTYWILFVIAGLGVYFFLKKLKTGELAALFGGLVYAITPYQFGLINASHGNKIISLAYFPWILLAVYNLFYEQKVFNILALALAAALQLWSNHPQMVYYSWMVIVFFWIWNHIADRITNKEPKAAFVKSTLFMMAGLILALVIVSDPYASVFEFQQHSDRGAPSVLDKTAQTQTGVKWDYATQWSFEPYETISFIYPYYYGMQNYPSRDIKSTAYWGGMQFTQSTHYFGILVFLLAILGSLVKKPDNFQIFLWVSSTLILLVGFGRHFPVLFSPLFYWAPFFSKFRVPSMIYAFLPFTFGLLAATGLDNILELMKGKKIDQKIIKRVIIVFGSFIGLTIFYMMFGNSILTFIRPGETTQYNPRLLAQIQAIRQELFEKGILLALFVSGCGFVAIWLGIKRKITPLNAGWAIIILTICDLWVVNNEFMNLKDSKSINKQFQPNAVTNFLTADENLFRIFPADGLNTNWYGYFGLSSIGGYRPVKLRNYQDLMDAQGFRRPQILNMLNVKYVLTQKKINNPDFIPVKDVPGIFKNTKVLPRAWIISDVKSVPTQKESLMETLLNGFDPSRSAVVMNYNDEAIPENGNGQVTVTSKTANRIELTSQSETGGLLVLSEIYYKPGWQAFVNDEETTIYQTNHVLRSVRVPAGQSKVVFEYDTKLWISTRILSKATFFAVLFGLGFLFWREAMKQPDHK
ncbi:MAG: YfhO family protein [Candidatus Neomarinimicrobiota bacterium]|nr:YfhO family protein [Candidatus Neomarinimicrobiota bacterium]